MLENQNAFQNAGQHGTSNYVSIGNQSSTFLVLVLSFVLLIALLKSEERYRELVNSKFSLNHDTTDSR
jgi:predicted PurR-regulated permease PerM